MAKQRGYSSFIVGLIFAVMPIPGLLDKLTFRTITDKFNCRRMVFVLSVFITSLLVFVMLLIPNTNTKEEMGDSDAIRSPLSWLFWIIITLFSATTMVKNVLEDTICMELLGENKYKYGEQRLWGSIGYSLLAIVSGICIEWYSEEQDFKNYTPCFVISLICFILDIIVVSTIKFIWNFLFWYLEDLSNFYHPETKFWIKTLQGLAILLKCFGGEVPSFFLLGFILKRVSHMNVFSIVFFVYALMFFLFLIIKNPVYILPVEILNGVTFALFYSGDISYANLSTPAGAEGTFQGVIGTALTGLGTPIGNLIGGYMFKIVVSIQNIECACANYVHHTNYCKSNNKSFFEKYKY